MINGKKSLFYTVLMADALMSYGSPKWAPSEEVAKSGNPVFEGWYADPEGIVCEDTYWVYPTTSDLYEKQTFFDCSSSEDLANWTKHTAILDTAEAERTKIAMWAPSVIDKDGRYYLFFGTNDAHEGEIGGIGVAVSGRLEGPYKDLLGKPLINEIVNGAQPIDQFVFHDVDNDGYYMYYGGWKRYNMVRLNKDFTGLIPFEDRMIYKEVTPKSYVGGPLMFKKSGKYYFMWSEGDWIEPNYKVAYAISDSPSDPFNRTGEALRQSFDMANGADHHSIMYVPNSENYYIVYHRQPAGVKICDHRETYIEKMTFNEEGLINPVEIIAERVEARTIQQLLPVKMKGGFEGNPPSS